MSAPLAQRLSRAATLDAELFAEVAADAGSTGQAIAVAIGVALAQGIAGLGAGAAGFLTALASAALAWLLWVVAIHVLALGLGVASDLAALVRALGFAALPLALAGLGSLPLAGPLLELAAWILACAAFVVAVRRVLAVETGRALGLVLGGLAAAWLLSAPLRWLAAA
jgi:hypothetical protein